MRDTLAAVRCFGARHLDIVLSVVIAVSTFLIAAGVSFSALSSIDGFAPSPRTPRHGDFVSTLTSILGHNLPAATFLFSGLATGGVSSLIGLALIGSFVGATTAGSAAAVGLEASVSSVMGYAPVEFIGLLVAAAAGLIPIVRAVQSRRHRGTTFFQSYVRSLPRSLGLFTVGLVVLVLAAAVEAAIIVFRGM